MKYLFNLLRLTEAAASHDEALAELTIPDPKAGDTTLEGALEEAKSKERPVASQDPPGLPD